MAVELSAQDASVAEEPQSGDCLATAKPALDADASDDDVVLPLPDAAVPAAERIRPHLIPARPSICIRAPCLKRNTSSPIPPSATHPVDLPASDDGEASDLVQSNKPSAAAVFRSVSLSESARHVHFDDLPPQEFYVHPGEKYDRRPIECTQGGSEFDMSLPPRCTSYSSDDEAEDQPETCETAAVREIGHFQDPLLDDWACIKNGTYAASAEQSEKQQLQPTTNQSGLTSSGKSVHSSLYNPHDTRPSDSPLRLSSTSVSASPPPEAAKAEDQVRLPVHGFRSFGGLSKGLSSGVTSSPTSPARRASPPCAPPAKQPVSPNATPMPSPSISKTTNVVSSGGGYFGVSDVAVGRIVEQAERTPRQEHFDPVATSATFGQQSSSEEDLRRLDSEVLVGLGYSVATIPCFDASDTTTQPAQQQQHHRPQRCTEETEVETVRPQQLRTAEDPMPRPMLPATWSATAGFSSPLSSRCSSVDPWSTLSSDGDAEGTDSPSNEASWISSSCTSPDLGPFDRAYEFGGVGGKLSPSSSLSAWLSGGFKTTALPARGDLSSPSEIGKDLLGFDKFNRQYATTMDADVNDGTREFSSSIETISAISTARSTRPPMLSMHFNDSSTGSESLVSASESGTPDTSRRPSLQHYELEVFQLSARVKGRKAQHAAIAAAVDEEGVVKLRARSSSRDGTVPRKSKSSKCKYCRMLRDQARKLASAAAGLDGSQEEGPTPAAHPAAPASPASVYLDLCDVASTLTRQARESPCLNVDGFLLAPSPLLSVRSVSPSPSPSREPSWDPNAVCDGRNASTASGEDAHSKPDGRNHDAAAAAEAEAHTACSEAADAAGQLPTECTCDRKREKELLRKKLRKEREIERERDREWERDQARGRQRRLFGDSFDAGEGACLSALGGF
ncbi:hypothetical protein ACQY0O_001724 [Thecaphora frezii]